MKYVLALAVFWLWALQRPFDREIRLDFDDICWQYMMSRPYGLLAGIIFWVFFVGMVGMAGMFL